VAQGLQAKLDATLVLEPEIIKEELTLDADIHGRL
jgi:hypothetical protein